MNPLGYAVLELLKAIAEWGQKHRQPIEDDEASLTNVTLRDTRVEAKMARNITDIQVK